MNKIMDKNKDRQKVAVENALDEKLIWKNTKTQRESEEEESSAD